MQIPFDKIVPLLDNELFKSVGNHRMPITCDSGADITVIPEECVEGDQFTGGTCEVDSFNKVHSTGRLCNVTISIAGRQFQRKAVAQPGNDLAWTVCLSMPYSNKSDRELISQQMDAKFALQEEDNCYLPAEMKDGVLTLGIIVSEGTLVPASAHTGGDEGTRESVNVEEQDVVNEQRECDAEVLVIDAEPSVAVEEVGERVEGSADSEEDKGVSIEGITHDIPRTKLAQAMLEDPSLETARALATANKEGYHYSEGILFRTRLDSFGKAREQICLPQQYRAKCLKLAHNHFGHQGRNKMVELIRPFFCWPTITSDCLNHIKHCDTCQRMDKSSPKQCRMQTRELVSVPSERVAIDLVGSFPTATGGFKFLLTSIDLATRWSEAIPIRTATAKVIISQLTIADVGFLQQ